MAVDNMLNTEILGKRKGDGLGGVKKVCGHHWDGGRETQKKKRAVRGWEPSSREKEWGTA